MKISWEYSTETEVERIVHTARQMVVGFYRLNGFNVVPYSPKGSKVEANQVYLPEFEYTKISRFWEKVKKVNVYSAPLIVDKDISNELSKMLVEANLPKPKINKLEIDWEKEFFETVEMVIPGLKGMVNKISVRPTIFGTKCSFNVLEETPGDLIIYLRDDQDVVYGLVEAILTALTRDRMYKKLEGSWQESEMLIDWLITESAIGKVIHKYHDLKFYQPTIKSTRSKQNAQVLKQSEDFYKKLGIPDTETLINRRIEGLSPQEEMVFEKLKASKNVVVTFEEISQIMTKNEDDFSLYAISKVIQRIRDKLETNGISGSYIQTMRGKGYVLKN